MIYIHIDIVESVFYMVQDEISWRKDESWDHFWSHFFSHELYPIWSSDFIGQWMMLYHLDAFA